MAGAACGAVRATAITVAVVGALLVVPVQAGRADTFTTPDTSGSSGQDPSIVLDAAGNPVISYYDSTNQTLRILRCGDPTCPTGSPGITSPDAETMVGTYSSLALDAAGNPVVSYRRRRGDARLKILHCNDPGCAPGGDSITEPTGIPGAGRFTSLALDDLGNPVVSTVNQFSNSLQLLHCNDPNCAGGDDFSVSLGPAASQDTSLVLDAVGNPVISYQDPTNLDLKILHCDDPLCAGSETATTPDDSAADVGKYSSLELDSSGNPVVAYWDATALDLLVLHCDDPLCAGTETPTRPDTAGDVGIQTSLVLDAVGNPVISYSTSGGFGNLRVLHCDDPLCAGSETPTRPHKVGVVGYDSSLALDAAGNPVIAYEDLDNPNSPRVLHCDDPACANGNQVSALGGQYPAVGLDASNQPVVALTTRIPTTSGWPGVSTRPVISRHRSGRQTRRGTSVGSRPS